MNLPLKILVCGDVQGKFKQIFSRVASVNAKSGPFEMLLCVGDFFGDTDNEDWDAYLNGDMKAPLPTFVLGPTKAELVKYFPKSDNAELCHNILYLGRKGIFTTSSGLQIAYLGGLQGQSSGNDTHFSSKDITVLMQSTETNPNFKGVDILLTHQWPKGISRYGHEPEKVITGDSAIIAQIALHLKPRYHFAGLSGIFYERQPYRNHRVLAEGAKHVTRFLALAKVGNVEKKKFLYAFNITPMKHMDSTELIRQPLDVTECPYQMEQLFPERAENKAQQFFYDMAPPKSREGMRKRPSEHQEGSERKKESKKAAQPAGPCWFCLSSPQVEKHLVVSVGNTTYLALAKGGLVEDHILILPIAHHQSTLELPSDILDEINKYKLALKKFFKKQSKTPVFYERNYKSQHLQIQVIPISMIKSTILKETFLNHADSQNIELNEIPQFTDLKQILNPGAPYFYVELESGEKLLHRIKKFFPLNFGREVLASPPLLDMEDRADWRSCEISKEEQTKLATTFRKKFEPFDFNS